MDNAPRVTLGTFFTNLTGLLLVLIAFIAAISFLVTALLLGGNEPGRLYKYEFYNALQGTVSEFKYDHAHARNTGTWLRRFPKDKQKEMMERVHTIAQFAKGLSDAGVKSVVVDRSLQFPQMAKLIEALENSHFFSLAVDYPRDTILRRIFSGDVVSVRQAMVGRGEPLDLPLIPRRLTMLILGLFQFLWTCIFLMFHVAKEAGGFYVDSDGRQTYQRVPYWKHFAWPNASTYLIFVFLFPVGDLLLLLASLVTFRLSESRWLRTRQTNVERRNEFRLEQATLSASETLDRVAAMVGEKSRR